jgi:hypothetical protein
MKCIWNFFQPSSLGTQEAEAGGWRVQGQSGLRSEILSQENPNQTRTKLLLAQSLENEKINLYLNFY